MQFAGDLDWLVACEELKSLQARRVRALDSQNWDDYRKCHVDDFISFTLGDTPVRGIENALAGLVTVLAGVTTVHLTHSPEFEFSSTISAKGVWGLHDRGWWEEDGVSHWFRAWGHYHDEYEKHDGRWLFSSRRIVRQRVEHSPGARLNR